MVPAGDDLNNQNQDVPPSGAEAPPPSKDESWARIIAPEIEAGKEKRIVVWGRFWGLSEEQAAAFFLLLEPEQEKIVALRLAVYGNKINLQEYNPRLEYPNFEQRILEYSVSASPVPTVTLNQVREHISKFIADRQNIQELTDILKQENEEAFYDWNKRLVKNVIPVGDFVFQTRGQIVAREKVKSMTAKKQQKREEGKVIRVSFVYSPGESVPVDRLREGMPVYVRVTGKAVEKMPEGMRDSNNPEKSVPVLGWVFEINDNPQLPADFDGEPADYKEVIVELNPGIYGRGYVYKEDRVKIDSGTTEPDVLPEDLIRIIALLSLLILIFLILIYAG